MSSGVSRTTSAQPMQQNAQVQTDKPRNPESANKFKESLQGSRPDGKESVSSRDSGGEQVSRDDGMRNRPEVRHQPREQGRVDSDGGRGNQGQSKGDDGKRDGQPQQGQVSIRSLPSPGMVDPRAAGPGKGLKPGLPGKPAGIPKGPTMGHGPDPKMAPRGLSRGGMGTGKMPTHPPGTSVRGTSPFAGDKMLSGLFGEKGKPTLRQTRTVGSRGMPAHRLQPEAKVRDPRFRGSLTAPDSSPRGIGRALRTPPPSPGAPIVGVGDKKGDKMPELVVQGHSSQGLPVERLDDGLRVDRDVMEVGREMRERDVKVVEVAPKGQVELQPRVLEAKNVQQTSKMSQAEIAEIVRKVESMVSKVQLGTTGAGDKQMALTIGDGRLKGVEIKVSVDKSGKLNCEFKAESADARNVLTEGIKDLEKSMQAKGLEVSKLEVGSDATGRRNFASQQEQQQKHEAAQAHLEAMEGGAQPQSRDPRMGAPKAAPARPTPAGVPGAVPSGAAVPTGQGPESSNYVA